MFLKPKRNFAQRSQELQPSTTSVAGFGDTFARLKINVLGDDYGAVAVALLPYVKLPTRKKCFYLKRDR